LNRLDGRRLVGEASGVVELGERNRDDDQDDRDDDQQLNQGKTAALSGVRHDST